MSRCTLCKKPLKATTEMYAVKVGEKHVNVEIPAERCDACDEVFTDYDAMKRAELAVALEVISSGQANGSTFRFLRHALGLKGTELADRLGTTKETISRWEHGERVDRMAWLVLALLVVGRIKRDDAAQRALDALAKPRPISDRVKLAS